jgi:hypothetical protein
LPRGNKCSILVGTGRREENAVCTIVVVSDRLAYAGSVALVELGPCPPGIARVVMDARVAQHRNAGWRVVDRRRLAPAA